MAKVVTFIELQEKISNLNKNKKVGLITGCFDVIHIGHTELFKFAKKKADLVIVGLDSDTAVKINKGANRPINTQSDRSNLLSHISTIDFIFHIDNELHFEDEKAGNFYDELLKDLKPHYIFTSVPCDKYHKQKRVWAKKAGVKLILQEYESFTSTTDTIKKLIDSEL